MKYFFALCCFLTTAMLFPGLAAGEWHTDFEKAKAEALKTKRPIYILFTNSDSAASLSFDRKIFNQIKFQNYADKKLVLMKVDFPTAIHLQSKGLQQQNRQLRTQFKVTSLPTAFLLDANGNTFIDFAEKEGGLEKHRKKVNEFLKFDPAKQYSEYLDGYIKGYTPPKPAAKASGTKSEANPGTKPTPKRTDKKPEENRPANLDTTIPDENGGIPLIPLDPEGNFQDWLNSTEGEAAKKTKEVEAKDQNAGKEKVPAESTETPAGDNKPEPAPALPAEAAK